MKRPKPFYQAALTAACGIAAKNEVNTVSCRYKRRANFWHDKMAWSHFIKK